jgi:hypothetical protein
VKTKTRSSVREVPLRGRAYDALLTQLNHEQDKGLGAGLDYVFTVTDREAPRTRPDRERGVRAAAVKRASRSTSARRSSDAR